MERKVSEMQIEQFRKKLTEDEKSNATIQKYVHDLKVFLRFIQNKEITKENVIHFKTHLKEKYKPASVNSMLAALNHFFKEMGWFDCVVKALKVQKQSFRSSERELTKAEYYRLLEAAEKAGNNRLYLLMQTICATGIRVSELPFITVEAVKSGRAIVSLKGKTRIVLIPRALEKELKKYIQKKKIQSGSIFVTRNGKPLERSNILHSMKKLCEVAEVDRRKVFPHNLRHLFACLLYEKEKDLSRLADILGHSNINTTRIYTCVSGEEQVRKIEQLGLVITGNKKTA